MPRRCALGCPPSSGVSNHSFPDPARFPEQFRAWVLVAGGKLETESDYESYRKKRVCDLHFTDRDRNRNNRLNALAVPSLIFQCKKTSGLKHLNTQTAKVSAAECPSTIDVPSIPLDRDEEYPSNIEEALESEDDSLEEVGPPIHEELASRWTNFITNGLSKEETISIMNKYPSPSNFKLLEAPEMNSEMLAAFSEPLLKRDRRITARQNMLGKVMTCIGHVLTNFMEGDITPKDIIEKLNDAAKLTAEVFSEDTKSRIFFALKNTKSDELFDSKDDVENKEEQVLQKTTAQIKTSPIMLRKLMKNTKSDEFFDSKDDIENKEEKVLQKTTAQLKTSPIMLKKLMKNTKSDEFFDSKDDIENKEEKVLQKTTAQIKTSPINLRKLPKVRMVRRKTGSVSCSYIVVVDKNDASHRMHPESGSKLHPKRGGKVLSNQIKRFILNASQMRQHTTSQTRQHTASQVRQHTASQVRQHTISQTRQHTTSQMRQHTTSQLPKQDNTLHPNFPNEAANCIPSKAAQCSLSDAADSYLIKSKPSFDLPPFDFI